MTNALFNEILGRALVDVDFQKRLLDNPEKALRDEGIEPTEDLIAQLKQLDAKKMQSAMRMLERRFFASAKTK